MPANPAELEVIEGPHNHNLASMKYVEIEYNQDLKPLEDVLLGVKRPGDFFVTGTMEMPMPKVEVDGAGMLSFPVPKTQIEAIVQRAERAPYGRGKETIFDTSVRWVWQIASSKVRIGGKSWAANFETILSKVTAGLGCDSADVSAELYKLLVYDRDGFFLAYRDTEKTDGMFGTLVVTLPSAHRGGELRIRHAGREVTVDTNAAEPSELSYVAFYADCEHEALPVREGSRVCLVYNLVQKYRKGKGRTLKTPEYDSEIAEAAAILDRSLGASEAPAKIAWLLEHQYSPAGLSFSALKGADAAKARVLTQAAARAGCVAHLGIVHIGDSGAAEPDDDEYLCRSRWNRYQHDEDDGAEEAEEDDDEGASFTVVTVDDAWQYIDEWRNTDDRVVEFGAIPLADGELLPEGALDEEPPDKTRLTEASGNEGASYERSYRRAALVLWRQERYTEVLLQTGVVAALPYLKQLAAGGKRARPESVAVAERMVEAWSGESEQWNSYLVGGGRPGPALCVAKKGKP
ncbi:MAG: 2OG-Fe(II) oxygenase [Acidobacteriaceae bacterium]|nr:2OG-Fe(II) oxygenase [Acidobacteriaceae bacterium]